MLGGLFFSGWAFWHRNTKLLAASQPAFLQLIVIGSLISMSAIFPVSMDHRDLTPEPDWTSGPGRYPSLDAMCMLQVRSV